MVYSRSYTFALCHALTPEGVIVCIPAGTFPVAHTDVVSIAIRGQILDITPASFELLLLDRKVTETDE